MFMFLVGFITGIIAVLLLVFILGPRILSWFFRKAMNRSFKNIQKDFFNQNQKSDDKWQHDDIL
ncbi:MAG: hypothetical protein V5A64_01990 [Candidatus Thermoplasmatota archaeon]